MSPTDDTPVQHDDAETDGRRPFHHAWPAIGFASILVALIAAARLLRPDVPSGTLSEPVQWLGLTIALTIGLARWTVRLLGGE